MGESECRLIKPLSIRSEYAPTVLFASWLLGSTTIPTYYYSGYFIVDRMMPGLTWARGDCDVSFLNICILFIFKYL